MSWQVCVLRFCFVLFCCIFDTYLSYSLESRVLLREVAKACCQVVYVYQQIKWNLFRKMVRRPLGPVRDIERLKFISRLTATFRKSEKKGINHEPCSLVSAAWVIANSY